MFRQIPCTKEIYPAHLFSYCPILQLATVLVEGRRVGLSGSVHYTSILNQIEYVVDPQHVVPPAVLISHIVQYVRVNKSHHPTNSEFFPRSSEYYYSFHSRSGGHRILFPFLFPVYHWRGLGRPLLSQVRTVTVTRTVISRPAQW